MAASLDNSTQDETKFIRQGAEAKLHKGFFYGRPCYSKERFSKAYRHPTLDKSLTFQRLKAEVRAINRCRGLGEYAACCGIVKRCYISIILEQNLSYDVALQSIIKPCIENDNPPVD